MRDGAPVSVAITVGLDDDANSEVLAGDLKPGDLVAVSETRKGGNSTGRGSPGAGPRLPRF